MAFIALFAGLGMFCALLWYCAVYALPVFVGFWVGWWALNHGAGAGCVAVGLIAGVALWLAGRLAAASGNPLLRWTGILAFVVPAALAGFEIVDNIASGVAPDWRDPLAIADAMVVIGITYARLTTRDQGRAI